MIRASSLRTVLHPARFARFTLFQSRWTNHTSSIPLVAHQNDGEVGQEDISSTSTSPAQPSSADSPAVTGNEKVDHFQLPEPASLPSLTPRHFVRRQARAYPVGKSWGNLPVPIIHPKVVKDGQPIIAGHRVAPFYDDAFEDLDLSVLFDTERSPHDGVDRVVWRRDLLRVLGNTQSHQQAWKAYHALVSVPFSIPHRHLNRLVRLLARERTKTRMLFGRLLSVLTSIHQSGWKIESYQWNALIDNAGKGLRKARPADFKLAFDMFADMVSSKAPGTALSELGYRLDEEITDNPLPGIITYTTLINHAADSRIKAAIQQSTSMLEASGIPPNRITHLVMLKYYSNTGNLDGVRASLVKMRQQNLELGLDGLNACIWAFSRNQRLDVAMKIYRILRHNTTPEVYMGPDDIDSAHKSLSVEGIDIRPDMVPNELTYTMVVQVMAYHGYLNAAITAFMDMLSADNVEIGAPAYHDQRGKLKSSPYSPTLPVFRGIFLGFYRHGVAKAPRGDRRPGQSKPWVLESLNAMFELFLALPEHIQPSASTIYWALAAFDKTSNHDRELLRMVWDRIEGRFGGGTWGHRLQRLRQSLFDPTELELGLNRRTWRKR
ncbi:hypothetical protein DFH07DRAFT_121129 [Mycena maculata]|uniref:Pentatricopeptide repeat protein n=1 Tax=Mycena maculata TaxID=230809 RepID=A0AAD7JXW7_9AGAR|nr:hypothetical protein DFH07DRAFT_121129 [Mycena maculata]